jgi:hypothetical protein
VNTKELLLEHFLNWQKDSGERKTLVEFASYIGMSDKQLNHYFTGRRVPGEKIVKLFAEKLQDQRFYDAAEIARPDPKLKYVQRNWGKAPIETQQKIAQLLAPYTTDPIPNDRENEPSSNH